MSRIMRASEVDAPLPRVLDRAITAGTWPAWQPACQALAAGRREQAAPGSPRPAQPRQGETGKAAPGRDRPATGEHEKRAGTGTSGRSSPGARRR